MVNLKQVLQRLLAITFFLLAWEIAVRSSLTYPASTPPASQVLYDLTSLALNGICWKHTLVSLQRIFTGYALAVIIAIPLGFLMGWFKMIERYFDPLLQVSRQVPMMALYPVFILFFGIGELPRILLLMLAAIWWILLSTISAVQNVDPFLVKTARSVGVSHWDMFRKVVLPSAVPSIFVGLRYAYTEVLLVLIAVEMLGANEGWGVISSSHEHHGQGHTIMYSMVLFMAIIGVIINYSLVAFEKRLCRWKEDTAPS